MKRTLADGRRQGPRQGRDRLQAGRRPRSTRPVRVASSIPTRRPAARAGWPAPTTPRWPRPSRRSLSRPSLIRESTTRAWPGRARLHPSLAIRLSEDGSRERTDTDADPRRSLRPLIRAAGRRLRPSPPIRLRGPRAVRGHDRRRSWTGRSGPASWRPVLDGAGRARAARPRHAWPRPSMPEIRDALCEARVRSISAETLAPLKQLARWLVEHHDGRRRCARRPGPIDRMAPRGAGGHQGRRHRPAPTRSCSHALKRPSYPVDRATYRILVRHGWLDPLGDLRRGPRRCWSISHARRGEIRTLLLWPTWPMAWSSSAGDSAGRPPLIATAVPCESLLPEGGRAAPRTDA